MSPGLPRMSISHDPSASEMVPPTPSGFQVRAAVDRDHERAAADGAALALQVVGLRVPARRDGRQGWRRSGNVGLVQATATAAMPST